MALKTTKNFQLTGLVEGKVKVDMIKQNLLSVTQENITKRFKEILEDKILDAMKLFDVNEWGPANVESCVERDTKFVQILYERFKSCLDFYEFNLAEAKHEWKWVRFPFSTPWQFQKW